MTNAKNKSENFDVSDHPHRRYNPLTGDWVLVSPHRAKRPWQGQTEEPNLSTRPEYDETCYLCPTNTRITGDVNPDYKKPFVFTNDFAALKADTPDSPDSSDELFQLSAVRGTSRVICFTPDHSTTMAEMTTLQISEVIETWVEQYQDLGKDYTWVQVFENKGEINGCSNPHPHGQIWASDAIPTLPNREDQYQKDYYLRNNNQLLLDYARKESALGERLVIENDDWIVVVPYWATWPFETMVLPKRAVAYMDQLSASEKLHLADILRRLTTRYDNLFQTSFAYSMGWHGAPFNGEDNIHWQLHGHFYPPLLRSASVKKFMVGYEMMAETQRDLTPEQAATRLREQSEVHYKHPGPGEG